MRRWPRVVLVVATLLASVVAIEEALVGLLDLLMPSPCIEVLDTREEFLEWASRFPSGLEYRLEARGWLERSSSVLVGSSVDAASTVCARVSR